MQSASLVRKQLPRTIPVQIQANAILNMSVLELQQFVETEAMENPALEVKEGARCPVCGFLSGGGTCPVCGVCAGKANELESGKAGERDYLQQAFASAGDDTFDPFRTVASTMDLTEHLKQQARLSLGGRRLRIAEYLIDCLDEDGYFRESLYDTAEQFAAAVPEIEEVLAVVQSFDPPGIGAKDLNECLLLQLRAIGVDTPDASNAERILAEHWDDLSKMKLKAIGRAMDISEDVVREACRFIKEKLTPHPASMYRPDYDSMLPRESAAIVPDVTVRKQDDAFVVDVVDAHATMLGVNETYDQIYQSMRSGDSYLSEEDCKHIKEHVERARGILDAIVLRKKALARVALQLVEHQREFLLHGPSHLKPLRQKDLAKALDVHESTICRAVADKYCRLPSGEVISFEVFFDSALPVRNLIGQLIAKSSEPLSDGEIAKRLTEHGVTIARRTVAKYRDQIRVLPCQLRAA